MHSSNVTFKKSGKMEIIEIKFPDGKVSAFPASDVNPESGRKYSELYGRKYAAFKSGDPDSDRVKELEREIKERQAELDGMKKADKSVQENLGYGKIKKDEDPHSTDYKPSEPKGIDQPATLGPSPAKPVLDPVLVQPVAPKEPV